MKPWTIIERDCEIYVDIPEFGESYFGDTDSIMPEEWAIVRQISATPMSER